MSSWQDMDFTFPSSSSRFSRPDSSSNPPLHGVLRGRRSHEHRSKFSKVVRRVFCATLACIFASVGLVAGFVTGGVIGLATESGLIRGAGVGAIFGAVFSIEVAESSLRLWNSRDSRIWSILYVLDVISSLFTGRLVREKIGPAMRSAVQSQMSAVTVPVNESPDFFETGGLLGLSEDSIRKLPKIKITSENNNDNSGEKIGCSVCLQDFRVGETVRSLPHCQHIFHLPCIDSWLVRHGSCPLCRRNL